MSHARPYRGSVVFTGLCAALYLFAIGSAAFAAQPLEQIVVTATKRGAVSAQDIAGGISAFSGKMLESNNLFSLDDYSRMEPSLHISTQGSGDAELIIRGIQSPGTSTVGLYFDDTVVTGGNFEDGGGRTPDILLHDINRVEVLKGPQGTLFGASSMSGTVRIITNKPDASGGFDANLTVGGASTEHGDPGWNVNGMVNIPLIKDVLAVRAVGWHKNGGGYIDHYAGLNGALLLKNANSSEVNGGRIMAKWTPNSRFTLTAYGQYQKTTVDDVQSFYNVPSGTLVPIPILTFPAPPVGPFGGQYGPLKVSKPSREPWKDRIAMGGVTMEYDMDFGNLVATANHFDRRIYSPFDTSPTSLSFGLPSPAVQAEQFQRRSITSTEVRFSSNFRNFFKGPLSRLDMVGGFFFENEKNFNKLNIIVADPATGIAPCRSISECLQSSATIPNIIFGRNADRDLPFWRIFGHLDYHITDQWTISAGAAHFDGHLSDKEFLTQGLPPAYLPPVLGGTPQAAPVETLHVSGPTTHDTWDAGVSYRPTGSQMYYVRAATGFRPGGANDAATAQSLGLTIPALFSPDTVTSVEVGAKTSWFNDRLTVNADYFKMFWNDIFVPGQDPSGAIEFIVNAASADINGVEFEMFARPWDPLYLTFGMTWLDARLSQDQSFPPGFTPTPSTPRGFKGDNIPKVPEWSLSGSVEYTTPLLFKSIQPVLRATYSYTSQSETYFNNTNSFNSRIGGYFLLNLNATFNYKNWDLEVYLNNVTDKLAIVDKDYGIDGKDVFTVRPRTVGVNLQWHFK